MQRSGEWGSEVEGFVVRPPTPKLFRPRPFKGRRIAPAPSVIWQYVLSEHPGQNTLVTEIAKVRPRPW